MDQTVIKEKVRNEIKAICFKNVDDATSLLESGLLDSITVVDLSVALEETFKLKIPFVDVNPQNFETIDAISRYIAVKMGSGDKVRP